KLALVLSLRSTRRTATVTRSVPEASWHFTMTSGLGYLPVPRMSRDLSSTEPIFSMDSCLSVFSVSPCLCGPLTPAYQGDDFQPVAFGEPRRAVAIARHHLAVELDGDRVLFE